MKISKGNLFKNSLLIILLVTSVFYYSKYKIEKNKNNFFRPIIFSLYDSSSENYYPLQNHTNEHININWKDIMKEIDNKRTNTIENS